MAIIYLIRHGQASFSKPEYDQLSDTGIEQANVLGKAFQARQTPSVLITGGSMKRHKQTAQHCLEHLSEVLPDYDEQQSWNEYDHMELLGKHRAGLGDFQGLSQHLSSQEKPMLELQRLLNEAVRDWMEERYDYHTSWVEFSTGIWEQLEATASQLNRGENAWVFTSGGPISVIVSKLLELKPEQFIRIQSRIINTSITRILIGRSGLSLSTYNDYSHLEAYSSLITYR